jgi:hypothetical protein
VTERLMAAPPKRVRCPVCGVSRPAGRLLAAGEPHPIKTIAANQHVDKSRASRWVKEARARGYIDEQA